MNFYTISGIGVVFLILSVVIYFLVFPEKREFPNTTASENIGFANRIFDSNRTLMPKIEDFDNFKYNGYDISTPLNIYTSNSPSFNPYSKTASTSVDPNTTLNSTIVAEDKEVDTAVPINRSNDSIEDTPSTLTGLNGNIESSIRESMVKSELRKIRK